MKTGITLTLSMYTLSHLKNCFKCMCLHLEFECFASKLEMTASYAWSRPLSLWWWHVLLSVTCDHRSWLVVFTVILYPRKYGLVTRRLGGDSAPTASAPGSATQLLSLGQASHHLALTFMWVIFIHMSEAQPCHCCAVFSSCQFHFLILQRCAVDRSHWSIGSQ